MSVAVRATQDVGAGERKVPTLDARVMMRRCLKRMQYEKAVEREAARVLEDVVVPELLRGAEEEGGAGEVKIIVPHIKLVGLPRDTPKCFTRKMYEEDVCQAATSTLTQRGLSSFSLTLERTFDDYLPSCNALLPSFFCLFPALPTRPLPQERCLTFTCTLPPLSPAKCKQTIE
eukprot:TRINITY_DN19979_c0_g1_i2.p1 TRINITY_DN19979_c0_g1~~TRINITY_DN19979_c0_g1_i2.p1  ORF type:complete len:174 (+),score=40.96 TRINITY_DN19979_c0_g1_i2:49-570(+)